MVKEKLIKDGKWVMLVSFFVYVFAFIISIFSLGSFSSAFWSLFILGIICFIFFVLGVIMLLIGKIEVKEK